MTVDDTATSASISESANPSKSSNESQGNLQHITSPSMMFRWICTLLLRISIIFRLTQPVTACICGLISVVLKLTSHPLHAVFPTSLYALQKVVALPKIEKTVFVVCPNDTCNCLYNLEEAQRITYCNAVHFGKKCGCELGYFRSLAFAQKKWSYHKAFHFIPPSVWLKAMFSDESFRTLLATSQNREVASDEKQDVYDGEIWKDFLENPLDTSVPFLSNQNNIGLMLNVDWFKPFKRSEYKVAALMMTVLNLPRAERFKERWTMILGIIPGPTEPKGNINTFLKPLVDDLLLLWDGLPLHPEGKTVKAALIALSADMPALRNVSQFVSHKADYGCSRCKFKAEREPSMRGSSGNMSYLTSIVAPNRTKEETTSQSKEYLLAKSKTKPFLFKKRMGFGIVNL